jgi:signal peptidase I
MMNRKLKMKVEEVVLEPESYSISSADLLELMQEVLAKDGLFRFKARGSSMTPFIRDGDVITITRLRSGKAGLGAIVAFRHPDGGHLVIHRTIKVASDAVLIKGDNNPQKADGWIPNENILGSVVEIKRDGKRVWLGLGGERLLIAFFSRLKWLIPLRGVVAALRGRK